MGNFKPFVSVLIPTYNGQNYLKRAIDSTLMQSFSDFELVIVDDASCDQTFKVASAYRDPRIRIFKNDHRLGLAANWNRCLSLARGPYIKYLHQDDELELNALREMVAFLEDHEDVGLLSTPYHVIDDRGTVKKEALIHERFPPGIHNGRKVIHESVLALENFIGSPSSVMLRIDLVKKFGLFDTTFYYSVDWEMWLRILGRSSWGYLAEPQSKFRVHQESETAKVLQKRQRTPDRIRLILLIFQNPDRYSEFSVKEKRHIYLSLLQLALRDAIPSVRQANLFPICRNLEGLVRLIHFLV